MDISNGHESPNSADDNYNIDDLSSGDETDDETQPRKRIPLWAQDGPLNRALEEQILHPSIDADTFFGPVRLPNLTKIFLKSRSRYAKRTSSALWTSPLSDPKPGTSKFFEALKKKRVAKPL